MQRYATPLEKLIEQFEKLPGIGDKTAQRLAFFMLSLPEEDAAEFARTIMQTRASIRYCSCCQNLTDSQLCHICASEARDHSLVCVVENPRDVAAIEKTREYKGVYHVLHGAISPMDNVGPDDIKVRELLERVKSGKIAEVIMATNPTIEGEATAVYVGRLLRPLGVRVTRLAYGIPVGADLEYADEVTLLRAIEGRKEI